MSERFEIELRVAGNDCEADAVLVAACDERLEYLLRRHADLHRHRLGREIVWIDFVLADFVEDAEGVEKPCGVGLHARKSWRRRFIRSDAPHAYLYSSAPRRKSNVVAPACCASSIACETIVLPIEIFSRSGSYPLR